MTEHHTHRHLQESPEIDTRSESRWSISSRQQTLIFVMLDVSIIWVATVLAYFVRFEGAVPDDFMRILAPVAIVASVVFPALFGVFGLYGYIWRYVGVPALVRLGWVTALGMGLMLVLDLLIARPPLYRPIPLGTLLIFGVLAFFGFFGIRMFGRLTLHLQSVQSGRMAKRVVIVGAGNTAAMLLRDIDSKPSLGIRVVGLLDDDPSKLGRSIGRARVLGPVADVVAVADSVGAEEIWIAISNAHSDSLRRVLFECGRAKRTVRMVPPMSGSTTELGVLDLTSVEVEDFLNREPVETDLAAVRGSIEGRRVLVTGAAGSIGAELCRQIAAQCPSQLVMLEVDESRLYEVFLEVREIEQAHAEMALCDIRDRSKMRAVFERYYPQVVVHAAAYKHVPLMEMEPDEAVRTNVQGTLHVLECCQEFGVDDFTLISTDKAVAPSSVMGATKRIAEKLSFAAAASGLKTTVVRFGNVLGSRGSVIPIFDGALRRGDAIRVTDSEVTRYFMTISEAVQLVLQARVLTDGCDLFVLDMGEPVKVLDLAQTLIELRGGRASVEFSGLRPAEKMHEVLVTADEALIPTTCPRVLRTDSLPLVSSDYTRVADELVVLSRGAPPGRVRELIHRSTPEYTGYEAAE